MTDFTAYLRLGVDSRDAVTAQKNLNNMAGAADKADRSFSVFESTASKLKGAIAGIGLVGATKQVIAYADAWTNVENVLTGVSASQTELASTQAKIVALSKDTFSSLDATARLYSEITRSVGELGVSQERVIGVTRTINNLFLAGGKSAAAASAAILQLNQGFASGVLRGDEFNSVAEGAPRILDAVAKYLNISRGALRDFAAEGGITAEILIGSLEAYEDQAQRAADITRRTFSQNAELARTFALEYVSSAAEIREFTADAGDVLVLFAKNLDIVANAVTGLAVIMGARLASSYAASIQSSMALAATARLETAAYAEQAAMTAKLAAEKQAAAVAELKASQQSVAARADSLRAVYMQIKAEQDLLQSKLASANAEMALEKARYKAQISDTGRLQSLSRMRVAETELSNATKALANSGRDRANVLAQLNAAEKLYATTSAQVVAAERAYTGAVTASSVATAEKTAAVGALTIASRAGAAATTVMNGALALVGGPAGLALIAAGALVYFATRASEAEKILEGLNPEVEGLAERFGMLGAAQKELARNELASNIGEQREKIASLNTQLAALNDSVARDPEGFFTEYQRDKILEVSASIESAQKELAAMQGQFDSIKTPQSEINAFITSMTGLNEVMGYFVQGNSVETFSMVPKTIAKETAKVSDEYKKLAYEIQKQIDLKGDESESASLAYDIQKGALEKLSVDEANRLVVLYKTKEAMDQAVTDAEKYADAVAKIQDAEFADLDRTLGKENKQWEYLEKQQQTFDSLIKSVDDFGGAWSRTGSIVADSLGSIVDVMDDYMSKMDSLVQAEADVAEARKIANNPKQIEDAEKAATKLSKERTKTEIASYRSIAGAAATMFKENSKGRKALHAVEKTLAAIELALAIKNTATELSLSATRTSAATAETGVNVAAGAAKFFAQSGWAGFAGVAAMVAAMAALGFSGGGGGGGGMSPEDIQAGQGTGTVLGSDEKSGSIANAQEKYLDVAFDQLVELRGIRDAMQGLSAGIAQLAVTFVAGGKFKGSGVSGLGKIQNVTVDDLFPGIAGARGILDKVGMTLGAFGAGDLLDNALKDIFGSTKKSIKDSGLQFGAQELGDILAGQLEVDYYNTIETTKKKLFGLSKKTSTKDELIDVDSAAADEITRIFGFMSTAVNESVSSLGLTTEKSLNDFVISIGKVSFKDLSGEEIQSELEAIFSQQADLMAEFLLPQITMYQQMGEGAFETLTRVAKEQAIFNDAIDAMGVSLGNVSAIIRIDVAQSIIDLVGGMENFTDLSSTYADKFISDAEKLAMLGGSLGDVFGDFGLSIPKTRDEFKALVSAQDLTTESGRKLFAALLEIAGATDEYISMIEDQREEMVNVSFSALQRSVNAEKAIIADQVAVLNTAISASKATYNALESSLAGMVISSNKTLAATRANAQSQLQGFLRGAQAGNLPSADDLKGALSVISQPSQKLFGTFEEFALDAARTAATIKELQDITGDQISSDEAALQELKDQSSYLDEMVTFAKEQIDILNGVDTSVISLVDAMNNFASTIGVQFPTTTSLAATNANQNETVAAKIEQVAQKQQADFKAHSDIMESSQIAIVENSLAIKKLLDKFDAIGIPLRDETISAITDPIVEAVSP